MNAPENLKADALLDLLREASWAMGCCPICSEEEDHASHCRLKAALDDTDEYAEWHRQVMEKEKEDLRMEAQLSAVQAIQVLMHPEYDSCPSCGSSGGHFRRCVIGKIVETQEYQDLLRMVEGGAVSVTLPQGVLDLVDRFIDQIHQMLAHQALEATVLDELRGALREARRPADGVELRIHQAKQGRALWERFTSRDSR